MQCYHLFSEEFSPEVLEIPVHCARRFPAGVHLGGVRPSIKLEPAGIQGNESELVSGVLFSGNDGNRVSRGNYYPLSHAGIQALQSEAGGRGR